MPSLLLRALEFGFYHCLLSVVDRVSRLPRNTTMPEAARLYRENIALKTQLDVVEARLKREEADVKPRPRRPLRERGAQELRMPPHSRVDSANMENRPARSPIKPS